MYFNVEGGSYDTKLKMNFNAGNDTKCTMHWFNQLIEELGEMPSYNIDSNETKNTSLKKLHHIIWKTFTCE